MRMHDLHGESGMAFMPQLPWQWSMAFLMRQGQLEGELEQLRAQLSSAQEHGISQAQVHAQL